LRLRDSWRHATRRETGFARWVALPSVLPAAPSQQTEHSDRGDSEAPEAPAAEVADGEAGESSDALRDRDVLYGRAVVLCVGVQHYSGVLHAGEYAMLEREPMNRFDSNAIKVVNHANSQVGHVKRNLAAALAPILDDPSPLALKIEAAVSFPPKLCVPASLRKISLPLLRNTSCDGAATCQVPTGAGQYNQALQAAFFGPIQFAEQTVQYLASHKIYLTGSAPEVRRLLGLNSSSAGDGPVVSSTQVSTISTQRLEVLFDDLAVKSEHLDFASYRGATLTHCSRR